MIEKGLGAHPWYGTYPAMEHSLVSLLECGVVIQYQNLTFKLVYCYLAWLVVVSNLVEILKPLRLGGGSSVFLTITIPLRTICRLVLFKARDTVWPASAEVTLARFFCILFIEV